MTERHPAQSIVRDLETDVADVEKWGDVLTSLGAGEDAVSRDAIFVIGNAVTQLGRRLDDRWKAAFAAGGGTP